MSYKLEKPYTEIQKADFIVEYNHNKGLRIEEGVNGELFALEPFEKLVNGEVIDNTEEYEQELAQKERERLNMLSLTAADVERAIYKAKGMDFEDILNLVEKLNSGKVEQLVNENDMSEANLMNSSTPQPINSSTTSTNYSSSIDLKALKIELKANNFYRGNPYVEQIGALLGYSSEELDYLFENGKFAEV